MSMRLRITTESFARIRAHWSLCGTIFVSSASAMPEPNHVARQACDDASTNDAALVPNATSRTADRSQVVHKMFEDVAAEHGGRIAVSFRGRDVTYRELDALANSVARHLREFSVRPGDIVAVVLPHSVEIVVAFL